MRKAQREITDPAMLIKFLDECQTIRLGLHDEPFPYIVPLSFGWEQIDGKTFIYFHCAKDGKKIQLIKKNNAVCFEADILNGYVKSERSATADYKSIIGFGFAEQVFCDDAMHGLDLLSKHCGFDHISAKECVLSDIVAVYKITVETMTGKQRFA